MAEVRDRIEAVPDLAPLLAPDADGDAARHHALFGLDVFPYGSHFLDPRGRLGGPVADATRRWLEDRGCGPPGHMEPDHLSSALGCLASAARAKSGAPASADSLSDGDLLWWLPVFRTAVKRAVEVGSGASPRDLWAEAVDLVWELVLDHGIGTGHVPLGRALPTVPPPSAARHVGRPPEEAPSAGPSSLPSRPPEAGPWPPPVEGPPSVSGSEGFGAAARFLTTPARAGFHLGRSEVTALARGLELPTGFGGRALLLENLLGASVRYDREADLVEGLLKVVEAYHQAYCEIDEVPVLSGPRAHWLQRAGAAADFVSTLF